MSRNIIRYAVPAILAAAVALVTYYFQAFTLLRQEGLGLFLNTPDFYRTLASKPLPVSHIAGSFLVQFYSSIPAGVAIVTGMVICAYFIAGGIFSRFGLGHPVFPTICSCAAWWFISRAESPSTGVAIILISGAYLLILSCFRRFRTSSFTFRARNLIIPAIIILGTASAVAFSKKIRENEKWSRIEFAAVQRNWDYLLKYATPQEARKDFEVTPWALLALNVQGRLEKEFTDYPISKEFGLDYGTGKSYRSSLFSSILYRELGVYNESVHHAHQSGDYLKHSTSFRTLRMLVQENYKLQDSLMVVKYCDILDRSTLHADFTRYFKEHPCPQRQPDSFGEKGSEPFIVITKDPMETLLQLGHAGLDSRMAMERYWCYHRIFGSKPSQ